MAKTNGAVSLGVSTLVVILIILVVGFGVYLTSTFNITSTTNPSTSSSSSSHVSASPTITTSTSTTVSNSGLYLLSFNQTSLCGPNSGLYGAYFIPWSVTLTNGSYNGTTKAQPPNSTGASNGFMTTENESYTSISFSVPDGTYNYTINPINDFENNQGSRSGTITINGNDVIVYVHFNLASCGSTITTTTSSKTSTSTTSQSLIVLDLSNGSAACQNIREGQEFLANWSGNVCTLTGSDNISSFALNYAALKRGGSVVG